MDAPRPEQTPEPPSLRASDAEREETARHLQDAFSQGRLTLAEFDERTASAYAARYREELGELTRDLAPSHSSSAAVPRSAADVLASPQRVTGTTGRSLSFAVLGGSELAGRWTLAAEHTSIAVMGGVDIDLRHADLQAQETTIRAFAIMGGIDILVPDDIDVQVDGIGLMGGFAQETGPWNRDPRPVRQAPPGAPRVRVKGLAVMGGVRVRRVPAAAPGHDVDRSAGR